jgi:2-polyprenyl-3-methyl-5-hydroxy-6-metoxy-1,4-benzoquinol methylase
MEWGGENWERLFRIAIGELRQNNFLNGAELLDIGTRYGKMAVLFSLMGARVTGIDIQEQSLLIAREEATKWNATSVNFMPYDGNLDLFPDESFDIIFTKSVLVVVPDLKSFLAAVAKKLKPNGKIVFLENGKGNRLLHAMRAIRHRKWDYKRANYFTEKEVDLIQSVFRLDILKRTTFPPVYLFVGRKRL